MMPLLKYHLTCQRSQKSRVLHVHWFRVTTFYLQRSSIASPSRSHTDETDAK